MAYVRVRTSATRPESLFVKLTPSSVPMRLVSSHNAIAFDPDRASSRMADGGGAMLLRTDSESEYDSGAPVTQAPSI